jgi:hypothetical protein
MNDFRGMLFVHSGFTLIRARCPDDLLRQVSQDSQNRKNMAKYATCGEFLSENMQEGQTECDFEVVLVPDGDLSKVKGFEGDYVISLQGDEAQRYGPRLQELLPTSQIQAH